MRMIWSTFVGKPTIKVQITTLLHLTQVRVWVTLRLWVLLAKMGLANRPLTRAPCNKQWLLFWHSSLNRNLFCKYVYCITMCFAKLCFILEWHQSPLYTTDFYIVYSVNDLGKRGFCFTQCFFQLLFKYYLIGHMLILF